MELLGQLSVGSAIPTGSLGAPQRSGSPTRHPPSPAALQDASNQLERWQQDIVDLGHEKRGTEAELAAAEAECGEVMVEVGAGCLVQVQQLSECFV